MGYYIDNLFNTVLLAPGKLYDELKIVSGYSSYSFLKEVSELLPNLKITLILGMTPYGISQENLIGYRRLCKANPNIKVYIQIEEPVTHIKLYQWYKKSETKECFIGSANFSHAGFKSQREILSHSNYDYTDIISETLEMSVHCLSNKIEESIKIYSDEFEHGMSMFIDNLENTNNREQIKEEKSEFTTSKEYTKDLRQLKRNITLDDDQVEVDLYFHNRKINRGLNNGKNSYLDIDKKIGYFDKFLKRNEIGTLEVNGKKLKITRKGRFSRELIILDEESNFHKLLCEHLGLDFNKVIDYADLNRVGQKSVLFTNIGNNRFKLDF